MTWWLSYGCAAPCGPAAPVMPNWSYPPEWACAPGMFSGGPWPAGHPHGVPVPTVPGGGPSTWIPGSYPSAAAAPSVGACCGSCASGGPCGAPCPAYPGTPAVGAIYVSDAELAEMGEAVSLFNEDVDAASKKEAATVGPKIAEAKKQCLADGHEWDEGKCYLKWEDIGTGHPMSADVLDPIATFQVIEWAPFYYRWHDYADQTIHTPGAMAELITDFGTLYDRWTKKLHQTTRAKVPPPPKEVLDTLAGAAGRLPWGWIAAGVALVTAPLWLPAIGATFLLVTQGKTLVPALAKLAK